MLIPRHRGGLHRARPTHGGFDMPDQPVVSAALCPRFEMLARFGASAAHRAIEADERARPRGADRGARPGERNAPASVEV